jgi:hypothetical protein
MRRRLLNFLTALSLLLCVGVIALWVRGAWTSDHLVVWGPVGSRVAGQRVPLARGVSAVHHRHAVYVRLHRSLSASGEPGHCRFFTMPRDGSPRLEYELAEFFDPRWTAVVLDSAGFAAAKSNGSWSVRFPDCAAAAVAAVLPAIYCVGGRGNIDGGEPTCAAPAATTSARPRKGARNAGPSVPNGVRPRR